MASFIYTASVSYRDARGQVGRVRFYINQGSTGTVGDTSSIATGVLTALNACTNAAPVAYGGIASLTGNQVLNPDQYGTNQEFPNVEDKAVLTFLMANNTLSRLSIPAPVGTGANNLFMPDGETVNPLATPIVNLVAALTVVGAHAETPSTKNGSPYNILVSGARARRRFQRKTTIWTLIPAETGPEE